MFAVVASLAPKSCTAFTRTKMKSLSLPLPFSGGRLHFVWEKNGALWVPGGIKFGTNLTADHFGRRGLKRDLRQLARFDIGSGLTTNVGALALANDGLWS